MNDMTNQTKKEFEDACRPAIAWLNAHGRPRMIIVIEPSGCTLQEEILASFGNKEYWTKEGETK